MTYLGHSAHLRSKPIDKQQHGALIEEFVKENGAELWGGEGLTYGPPPMSVDDAYTATWKYNHPDMSDLLDPESFFFGEECLRRNFKGALCNRACTRVELENFLLTADHTKNDNLRNPARVGGPGAIFDRVSADKTPWLRPGKVHEFLWCYPYTIPISSSRLKYEMRPLEKGPRHYNPGQVNHYVMGVNLFSHHHERFLKMFVDRYAKTAVGINPFQGGWDELYRRLKRKSARYISTDINKQDAHMMAKYIFMVRDLFLEFSDFTDIEKIWAHKWFDDLVHTIVVLPDGHCYLKHVGNPSGNFLTCMINTFHTIFVMAYSLFRNGMITTVEQFEELLAVCFGDDSTMEWGKDWDFTKYASTIASELGHDLTLESPLGHLRDQVFLSKSFYKPPGLNVWAFIPTNFEKNFASLWYNNGNDVGKYLQMVASYRMLYFWSQPHYVWLTNLYKFIRKACRTPQLEKAWIDNFKSDRQIRSLHLGVLEGLRAPECQDNVLFEAYSEMLKPVEFDLFGPADEFDVLQGGETPTLSGCFVAGRLRPVIINHHIIIMVDTNNGGSKKRSRKRGKGKSKKAPSMPPAAPPMPKGKGKAKKAKKTTTKAVSYSAPYAGEAFIKNQSFASYMDNAPVPVNLGGRTNNCVFFDRLIEFTTPASGSMDFTIKPNLVESLIVNDGSSANGSDVKGSYLFNGGAGSHNAFDYGRRGHMPSDNSSGYHLTFPKGTNECFMDGIAEFDINATGNSLVRALYETDTEQYMFPISGATPASGAGGSLALVMNRTLLPADAGHAAESFQVCVQYRPAGGVWTNFYSKVMLTADGQAFAQSLASGLPAAVVTQFSKLRFGFVATNLRAELSVSSASWSVNTIPNFMTAGEGSIKVYRQNADLYQELSLQNQKASVVGVLGWWAYEGDLEKSGEWVGSAQPQGVFSRDCPGKAELLQKSPWKRIRLGKGLVGIGYMNNTNDGFTPHPLNATNIGVDELHVCVETNGSQKISLLMVHCVYYEPTTRFTATVKVPQEVGAETNLINFIVGSEKIFENENHIKNMMLSAKRALSWAGANQATIEKYVSTGASLLMKVSRGVATVSPLLLALL